MTEPLKPNQVRFTYYGKADDLGRFHFAIEWIRTTGTSSPLYRAQHFFADPTWYLNKYRESGHEILEVHEGPLR
jgi:hypothetical protein